MRDRMSLPALIPARFHRPDFSFAQEFDGMTEAGFLGSHHELDHVAAETARVKTVPDVLVSTDD